MNGTFAMAMKDRRVWALFVIYGTCFGIELTINNIAALYFKDYFGLGLRTAGLVAGLFGLMNIFARTTGGIIGDLFGQKSGLKGRAKWLFIALLVEGIALMVFSQMKVLPIAIGSMVVFSLFVQMSEGATYSVVPFINKKALGSVAGIVGAGGNMGAVCAGFLFRAESLTWPQALLILGGIVFCCSFLALTVGFSPEAESEAKKETDKAISDRRKLYAGAKPRFEIPMIPELLSKVQPMDLLRVYLGIALALKGIYFIMNMGEVERLAGGVGLMEDTVAWFVVLAHVVGGICLAIGFVTRFSAGLNVAVLLGAIMFVHSSEGLFAANQGLQLSLFALVTLLLLMWRGSGRYSVDHLLRG